MIAFEAIQRALQSCGYPATQIPVTGDAPVYVGWQMIVAVPKVASNGIRRITTTFQVDVWGRLPIGPELYPVLKALTKHKLVPVRWGPQIYEQDTGWHHLPVEAQYTEVYDNSADNDDKEIGG